MSKLHYDYLTEVYLQAVELGQKTMTQEERLENGRLRREEMRTEIKNGIQPTGPRATWLKNCASEVIELLKHQGQEFNDTNADDRVSVDDWIDIITTVLHWLKRKQQG